MREAIREYRQKNIILDKVAGLVSQFFQEEGFTVQSAKTSMGHIIQAKKGGFFRTILAMNRAFTIVVEGEPNDFRVRIGVAEWLADLGMAAVESFFISPLLAFVEVPESLWSFEIEHQLWHFIENQMELGIQ